MFLVIDDVYSKNEVEENEKHILENVTWEHGAVSNVKDATFFWNGNIDHVTLVKKMFEDCVLEIFMRHSIELLNNYYRAYLNGRTYELHGNWHIDYDKLKYHTLLYMMNTGDVDDLGDFQYIDPSNEIDIKTVPFKSGRFILFPSHWKHRGLAPSVKNKLRVTLAYKGIELSDQI
jgi:hypothetical protein